MTRALEVGCIQLFAPDVGKPLQWRLLSGNNRESGRAVAQYQDVESCREGVRRVQAALDRLTGTVRRTPRNQWVWQLLDGDVVVAVAGREYDRAIRCEQALDAFRRGLRDAPITTNILVSNARRWETRAVGPSSIGRAAFPQRRQPL
jgi:hypothetical protein